ncbi:unnamed protein product, partial [Mesorhabditis spiculigera]
MQPALCLFAAAVLLISVHAYDVDRLYSRYAQLIAEEPLLCQQQPQLCSNLYLHRMVLPRFSKVPSKRAYDFVRFGRSDPSLGKEKKNSYDYIRFGKRSSPSELPALDQGF